MPNIFEVAMGKAVNFEPHPESMTPRVFVQFLGGDKKPTPYKWLVVAETYQGKETKVYELLRDGQAVEWPNLPPAEPGFDFWLVTHQPGGSLEGVTLVRNKPEVLAAPKPSQEALDALTAAGLKPEDIQ